MISVSGKYWEEEKINNRAVEKTKLENNFQEFTSKQIILKKFDKEEIYSINNDLDIFNPFLNKSDFIEAAKVLDFSISNNKNEVSLIIQIKENLWNNKRKFQIIIIDLLKTPNKA